MKNKGDNLNLIKQHSSYKENNNPQNNQLHPGIEDLYSKSPEENDFNPINTSTTKKSDRNPKTINSKKIANDESGSNLNIITSELDIEQGNLKSEYEKNNYYFKDGDDHEDRSENRKE